MNFANGKYTDADMFDFLSSSSREVKYEFMVADAGDNPIGIIDLFDASINYDSDAEVKRTLKASARKTDIVNLENIDYRIIPYFCIKVKGDWIKYPLGRFICEFKTNGEEHIETVSINGYDLSKIAQDDKITSRFYVPEGAVYTSYVAQILRSDYTHLDVDISASTKASAQEWAIGTSKLKIANEMLNAIGYTQLHFDEQGIGIAYKELLPQLRDVEASYVEGKKSVILDDVSIIPNSFDIPNKFVRYTESADSDYMIATYTNNDESNPYSTVSRGRVIVDSEAVSDIADQTTLNYQIRVIAAEKMAKANTIEFNTLNMPCHSYKNCLYIAIPTYGITGRYIETSWGMELKNGGIMTHRCEKVVTL